MKKDCPYCEGKNGYTYLLANSNTRINCEYCVKGVIPKPGETKISLLERIKNFFGNNDAPENT